MTRRALGGAPAVRRPRAKPEDLPFPTAAQMDLLKAAVLPAEHAAPAWQRWKARGLQLQTVEDASHRMFSPLWVNRDAAAIGPEDRPLLKGVYRAALANNAVVLASALDATQILTDAGIPVLFFKGAAMIATAPNRLGLRRTADGDVLIPESDAVRAVALLTAAGFPPKDGYQAGPLIGILHAWTCTGPNDSELDVHWSAFKTPGDDRVMFDTARAATLLGRPVLIPSATEMLIISVANGFSRAPASPLRWIADALLVLQTDADAIQWETLVQRARRPGLTLGLTAGLEFLAREFGAPVPPTVLAELRRLPVSWQERSAHWAAVNTVPRKVETLLHEAAKHRARRLHYSTGVPRDLLGHLAQSTGAMSGKRRDVFERAAVRFLMPIFRS